MKVPYIIGADLSKKSIDFASYPSGKHLKITNDLNGFDQLMAWLKEQTSDIADVLVVMEHTGLYSYQLEQYLYSRQIRFSKVSGLAIKRSMGLVRGKTDKLDALRIARYGFEKADRLIIAEPVKASLHRLQLLHSTRERLVRNRASLMTAVKEIQLAYELAKNDPIIATQLNLIRVLTRQIEKLDMEIEKVIHEEQEINQNYQLLQSITGVGKVLSVAAIVKTNNFARFANGRKFACFCGTAPFENSSGTSIRGKTRVSHLADKRMKTLLDLAAKCAIQYDKELRDYYQRRIAIGKSKMSTINVVRNKIIHRMFAVVKRRGPYQPLTTAA